VSLYPGDISGTSHFDNVIIGATYIGWKMHQEKEYGSSFDANSGSEQDKDP
jgi:hypothetical protein